MHFLFKNLVPFKVVLHNIIIAYALPIIPPLLWLLSVSTYIEFFLAYLFSVHSLNKFICILQNSFITKADHLLFNGHRSLLIWVCFSSLEKMKEIHSFYFINFIDCLSQVIDVGWNTSYLNSNCIFLILDKNHTI